MTLFKKVILIGLGLLVFYWTIKNEAFGKIIFGLIGLAIFLFAGFASYNLYFEKDEKEPKWYVLVLKITLAAVITLSILGLLIYIFGRGNSLDYEDINER